MAIDELIQQLDREINKLQEARQILGGGEANAHLSSASTNGRRGRRHMSAAARARISATQKARWAKRKGTQSASTGTTNLSTRKRTPRRMSAAGRARIAAAQKARWAKVKAQKRK
jgi:hypothetical protein